MIAGATFLIILFAVKPELIGNIWLWIIGLAGAIVKAFQMLIDFFKEKFSGDKETTEKKEPEVSEQATVETNNAVSQESFKGISLTLLRYSDDRTTTIGLLSVNNQFYCYTRE